MYKIVARDKNIVDYGVISAFVMAEEDYNQIPEWRKNEYSVYASATTEEEARSLIDVMPSTKWSAIRWSQERKPRHHDAANYHVRR